MPVLFTHPTGSPFAREAARAIDELGELNEIVTTFAFRPEALTSRFVSVLPDRYRTKLQREFNRRDWCRERNATISQYPSQEILRVLMTRSGIGKLFGFTDQQLADLVFSSLDRVVADRHLPSGGFDAVYSYEDCAAETFIRAHTLGVKRIYDLPIAYHKVARRILNDEGELYPEFASSLGYTTEPEWKVERKEIEVALAEKIIVASSFTERSLLDSGIAPGRIIKIPYGAPALPPAKPQPSRKPFTVLFVGRVGPRKGVHYLLRAWNELKLPDAELRLIGVNEFPAGWLEKNLGSARYLGVLPNSELDQHYRDADLMILPSLVEGFGLVLLESLAYGVPIIATPHTGAPDFVVEGQNGFIIPIRSELAIKERIEWGYTNRAALKVMSDACRETAQQLSWNNYRTRLQDSLREILRGHTEVRDAHS